MPANIDDKETYRVVNNTVKNTVSTNKLVIGVKHTTTPNIVATPYPPLKPANTGNTCPTKAAIPNPSSILTKGLESNVKGVK
jgi:hypothetical protein